MKFKPEELCSYYVPMFRYPCQHCKTDVFGERFYKKPKLTCPECKTKRRKSANDEANEKRKLARRKVKSPTLSVGIDIQELVVK